MLPKNIVAASLLCGAFATALMATPPWEADVAAQFPQITHAISGAGLCVTGEGRNCVAAAAATIDRQGHAGGAFAVWLAPDSHLIVSAKTGAVSSEPLGALRAILEGPAVLEQAASGAIAQHYRSATVTIDERRVVEIALGDATIVTTMSPGGIGIQGWPDAQADAGTHEVGHYIGLHHTFESGTPPLLGFGFIGGPDGLPPPLPGYPDVAGLFRDTAEGETGHAHGHLDFLKKIGDPATGQPPLGFDARGSVACLFADRSIVTNFRMSADFAAGTLDFRTPRCGFRELLAIRPLPCPAPCQGTVIVGPVFGAATRALEGPR